MVKKTRKFNRRVIWFSVSLVFLFGVGLAEPVRAQGASLSIFPQTGTFTAGNTFDVSVFVNTGGNDINVVKVDLKFDPEKLQVITPAKGVSIVGEWTFPPSFSNTKGTIILQGGFPGKGINTSEGLVTVIVFKAMSSGETIVDFLSSSKVLLGEKGENILSSINRGVYNIILSPPKGPRVFSETHPDQNKWHKSSNPTFSWDRVEGAEGYSFEINDDPFGEPDNVIDVESTSTSFEEIDEGIQYFHLKAKKADIWGGISHFKIMVDKTLPAEFKPRLEASSLTPDKYLLIYFETEDLLSGIESYQVRIADYTDSKNVLWSGWMRNESPFRLSTEKKAVFQVFIRVFDKAGNFQEEKIKVRIFSPGFIIGGGGILIEGLYLSGWLIWLLVIVILFGIGRLIFRRIKRKSAFTKVDLEKEIKEAEKEIEDVRKAKEKLGRMKLLEKKGKEEFQSLKQRLARMIKSSEKKEDEQDE